VPNKASKNALHLLDVGCGPATASLAVTDLLNSLLVIPELVTPWNDLFYTFNDTSEAGLLAGVTLLGNFRRRSLLTRNPRAALRIHDPETIVAAFPESAERISIPRHRPEAPRDSMLIMSYVVGPLVEKEGVHSIARGIRKIVMSDERRTMGLMLIEDQFHEKQLRSLARELELRVEERTLSLKTYWAENHHEIYTYRYYVVSSSS